MKQHESVTQQKASYSPVEVEERSFVNIIINDKTPAEYWCGFLNCEKPDLLYAMASIGNSYKSVDDFLILNRRKIK